MRLLLACLGAICLVVGGCATNVRDITYADGSRERVTQTVFLETMQGYTAGGVGLDGTSWSMGVQNLTGDTALASVIFSGIDSLASKALLFAANGDTNLMAVLNSATNGQSIVITPSQEQKARRYMMIHGPRQPRK